MRISKNVILAVGVMAAMGFGTGIALADSSSGQLVYYFTYGSQQNVSARDSNTVDVQPGAGDPPSSSSHMTSGVSDYQGHLSDKGTMTVQVMNQQPDGGLIVAISEQGQNYRRASPATCVVYGDGRVICDPNKTVFSEEYTLLRFLGPNFVDPNKLDANKHWATAQDDANSKVKADYTVNSNNNGNMQISEKRSVRPNGGGSQTTDVQTMIGYDATRAVPTGVDEYVIQRLDNGAVGSTTTIYQTTLKLVSDSMAKT
jgi:hypothetical protein